MQIIFVDSTLDSKYFLFRLKLAYYLSRADVVITTASMSSLEILAREVSCGVACAKENQLEYYSALKKQDVVVDVGECFTDLNWIINNANLNSLLENRKLRLGLVEKTRGLIDLGGPARIVDVIENL